MAIEKPIASKAVEERPYYSSISPSRPPGPWEDLRATHARTERAVWDRIISKPFGDGLILNPPPPQRDDRSVEERSFWYQLAAKPAPKQVLGPQDFYKTYAERSREDTRSINEKTTAYNLSKMDSPESVKIATPNERNLEKERKDKLLKTQYLKKVNYWEKYYTGCDVGVFIGDIWVDDIITIQYTHTNNKSPIYGYMSEQFDAVARGTNIVQGQFVVAFTEAEYISRILDNYKKKVGRPDVYAKTFSGQSLDDVAPVEEVAITGLRESKLPKPDKYGYINTLYGNIVDKGFDIIVSYGDISENYRGGTAEFLDNVHITSRSIVCEPSGDPIAVVFAFFARAYNENIPNSLKPKEIEDAAEQGTHSDVSNTTEADKAGKQLADTTNDASEADTKSWYQFWK